MEARLSLIFSLLSILSLISLSFAHDLQIVNAERRIDLTSHNVKVFLTFKVENTGTSPASEFLLAFPPAQAEHLALVKAAVAGGKKKKKIYIPLDVNPTEQPDGPNGAKFTSISLKNALNAGESATYEALLQLTHSLEPFPAKTSQSESQLVYYHDSAIILSPYFIKQQTTFIKTPSTRVESFSRVDPANQAGRELKYGPYVDCAPYSFSPIIIHFENNNPFAVVEELACEVEVSHWDSLQITEHYKLGHAGARHRYSLPLQDFLFEALDGRHYLNFSFGCPLLEMVVDKLTIKVVLPEGYQDPSAEVPFPVQQHLETSYSCLDMVGRTVVVLEKANVVPEQNSPFRVNFERCYGLVHYTFKPFFMLAEPLMLASVFFLFFVACVAYLHMDFSISKS
ncbi:Ribophorin I [Dillenia turbinata]|uniref:Dolichyl-diphosphooligosaccharide--protein glycosyltransferase subunit 1 n=1 Tax=Dillenia turbinata TaxID=194707 RepID=A0AAN8VPG3_9MAGN